MQRRKPTQPPWPRLLRSHPPRQTRPRSRLRSRPPPSSSRAPRLQEPTTSNPVAAGQDPLSGQDAGTAGQTPTSTPAAGSDAPATVASGQTSAPHATKPSVHAASGAQRVTGRRARDDGRLRTASGHQRGHTGPRPERPRRSASATAGSGSGPRPGGRRTATASAGDACTGRQRDRADARHHGWAHSADRTGGADRRDRGRDGARTLRDRPQRGRRDGPDHDRARCAPGLLSGQDPARARDARPDHDPPAEDIGRHRRQGRRRALGRGPDDAAGWRRSSTLAAELGSAPAAAGHRDARRPARLGRQQRPHLPVGPDRRRQRRRRPPTTELPSPRPSCCQTAHS